eukprot:CAMPEP_0197392698 /NCGR_PEP_ID=MMETSP1165-20131217/3876_1 /TAXON_ID=284809 /ORGANISM="Chrysocystis fragilis, Strain CCMP3189" /LENGTH=149 /DNA_ID=CAMNT_0042918335 /DNA_START=51 /DNA_END=501 /DNA_ORIENTATION=+
MGAAAAAARGPRARERRRAVPVGRGGILRPRTPSLVETVLRSPPALVGRERDPGARDFLIRHDARGSPPGLASGGTSSVSSRLPPSFESRRRLHDFPGDRSPRLRGAHRDAEATSRGGWSIAAPRSRPSISSFANPKTAHSEELSGVIK